MNIYVGNLNAQTGEQHLRELFGQYGKVTKINIIMDHATGQSQGFGFVEMDDRADGNEAIRKLNKLNFMTHYLEVSEARPNTSVRPGANFSQRGADPVKKLKKK
jgi:RNA recognition motif-containing protein